MRTVKTDHNGRGAFTLIELIVVIAIILVIAALAAAFAPRVTDSQNLSRAVDQFEQWLLTAKMRAKRDGLATGIRFIPGPNDVNPANPYLSNSGTYYTFQYIQQPDPLSGGSLAFVPTGSPPAGSAPYPGGGNLFVVGGLCLPKAAATNTVQLYNVDVSLGLGPAALPTQLLVQPGDYLEMRDGGVYLIASASVTSLAPAVSTLTLAGTNYDTNLTITAPTTNYRILRQPRILIGESPLQMPGSLAVDMNAITGTAFAGNVQAGPSGYLEILFSPSGAVVGTNAGSGKVYVYIHDTLQFPVDPNKAGIVAVQTRTGFIGAYSVAAGSDPFFYAEEGRESGL